VRELVEFKQQYPNSQAIIVKTSEQKWSISLQVQKGYNVLLVCSELNAILREGYVQL
jgi:hypothetical protein